MKTREIGSKKILAFGLITLLAIAILSTSTSVFAKPDSEKGKGNAEKNKEKGQSQQEGKNKDSKGKNNSTSSTNNQASANATGQNSTSKQYNHEESSKNKEFGNQSATVGSYTVGMDYILNAKGSAIPISDDSSGTSSLSNSTGTTTPTNSTGTTTPTNSTAASNLDDSADVDATISLNLSVWKSTKGLVSFKVTKGMIMIGDETYEIHSGKAIYILKAHKVIVTAFTEDNGKPLKLKAIVLEDTTLPATLSDPALQLDILNPQSKLASKYFLEMGGEIVLS